MGSCLAQDHFRGVVVLCLLHQYLPHMGNYGSHHQLARKMRRKAGTLWTTVPDVI